MDSADKFNMMASAIRTSWFSVPQKDTLLKFINEIEERWDMFEEES